LILNDWPYRVVAPLRTSSLETSLVLSPQSQYLGCM
jgi:hypothetical protein